jgi:hypothetical protein
MEGELDVLASHGAAKISPLNPLTPPFPAPYIPDVTTAFDAHIFSLASPDATGEVPSQSVVQLLRRSGLPNPILKEIWTLANARGGASLTRGEFSTALRGVALAQAGQPLAYASSPPPGLPLPYFEGIAVPAAAVAAAPAFAAPTAGSFAIGRDDQAKYDLIFRQTDVDGDGFVMGNEAVALFTKSGLPKDALKRIWEMSDIDGDRRLDHAEFSVAMHLVVSVSKRGLTLPTALPAELIPVSKAAAAAPAPAPPAAQTSLPPLPPQASSFTPVSLDDAFGVLTAATGLAESTEAPPPAPMRAASPALVNAPAPPPVQTVVHAPAPLLAPIAAPSAALYSTSLPQPHHAAYGASTAAASAFGAPPVDQRSAAASDAHGHSAAGAGSEAQGAAQSAVLGSVVSDLESAMESQMRRERALLDAKKAHNGILADDLKRLEQERLSFRARLDIVRNSIAEEDAESVAMFDKMAALRRELDATLRPHDAAGAAALADRRKRNAEASGVLAALAASAQSAGLRVDGLSAAVRSLLDAIATQELGALRLDGAAKQLEGVAVAHGVAASADDEAERSLRAAARAADARTGELEAEKSALEARLRDAGVSVAAATDRLKAAETALVAARDRHAKRCARGTHAACARRRRELNSLPLSPHRRPLSTA